MQAEIGNRQHDQDDKPDGPGVELVPVGVVIVGKDGKNQEVDGGDLAPPLGATPAALQRRLMPRGRGRGVEASGSPSHPCSSTRHIRNRMELTGQQLPKSS